MDNNNNNNNKDKKPNESKKNNLAIWFIAIAITLVVVTVISNMANSATTKEISYNEFIKMLDDNKVKKVEFSSTGKIIIYPTESSDSMIKFTYWTADINDPDLIKELKKDYKEVEFKGVVQNSNSHMLLMFMVYVVPIVLFYLLISRGVKKMSENGGDIMGVGKSKAKMYDMQKETGVMFNDVAGQDEAKESLTEIVDFIHNPDKYSKIGAKLPKGALLVGPPGTGKTLLAKAVAGEANVPFFSISGSDFVEMFVGVGASRVRSLFEQAQKHAPCIVFIDEIDAIGKSRDARYGGGNDEREQTLNQLLAEMDGFDTSKGVFLLAATNRPEVLDKALLRPGRFDRRIIVDKPDLKGRIDTLKVHSKDVAMDETVDLEAIALATSGAVGSDLANMINEAAIMAVKNGRAAISQADLFESVEVVIAGKEKKDRVLGEQEKKTVAYHEVGHALATALQKDAEPVQKITIVPRTMGSLGYVMSAPEEEKFLMTQKELEARLVTLLAGRAAEEIVFDTVTTGASNDMEKATDIARAMITQFGMSKKFGLVSLETVESKYLDGGASFNCSEETQAEIDKEIREILKAAYEESKRLLIENREVLDEIATFLYEKETITGKQFMEIFHRVRGDEVKESEEIKNSEDINDSEKVGVIETSEIADTSESVEKSEVSVGSIEQSEVAETSEQ
ncbi:ATP-dependent zinc metalloprotease FtsH [Eubacterium uniforme]|uniref:ATP-dependent zinc metalloprotease FtsH n=1 Tax=Eubacterium uniforme TaxID=39495 RepID=A0A1T4VHP5_9FIRM|nr:ATP-dependent zinc metalloprotease FtsH [Eubacterium uniforme]SKA64462.1 cell division protease FtsH [Eubacterium uniforme]